MEFEHVTFDLPHGTFHRRRKGRPLCPRISARPKRYESRHSFGVQRQNSL